MTEKKETTKKATASKAAVEKKAAPRRSAAKKTAYEIDAVTVGFKAGDIYQTLSTAESALSVAEIAKAAKIKEEEVLLGMGWLLKEGKIKAEGDKIALA